jgi:hypothetical protein
MADQRQQLAGLLGLLAGDYIPPQPQFMVQQTGASMPDGSVWGTVTGNAQRPGIDYTVRPDDVDIWRLVQDAGRV